MERTSRGQSGLELPFTSALYLPMQMCVNSVCIIFLFSWASFHQLHLPLRRCVVVHNLLHVDLRTTVARSGKPLDVEISELERGTLALLNILRF